MGNRVREGGREEVRRYGRERKKKERRKEREGG